MIYSVVFSEDAKKDLKKLNKSTAAMIIGWIEKNLQGCENPRFRGKPLTANRSGQWRYRIGDYRVICLIEDSKLIITALSVGHRSIVYKDK